MTSTEGSHRIVWALEALHVLAHEIRLASESPFLAATYWALAS
jgi:hypothetical protein